MNKITTNINKVIDLLFIAYIVYAIYSTYRSFEIT